MNSDDLRSVVDHRAFSVLAVASGAINASVSTSQLEATTGRISLNNECEKSKVIPNS